MEQNKYEWRASTIAQAFPCGSSNVRFSIFWLAIHLHFMHVPTHLPTYAKVGKIKFNFQIRNTKNFPPRSKKKRRRKTHKKFSKMYTFWTISENLFAVAHTRMFHSLARTEKQDEEQNKHKKVELMCKNCATKLCCSIWAAPTWIAAVAIVTAAAILLLLH